MIPKKEAPSSADILAGVAEPTNYKDRNSVAFYKGQANFGILSPEKSAFIDNYRKVKIVKYALSLSKMDRGLYNQWIAEDINFELCMRDVEEDIADEIEYALMVKAGIIDDKDLYIKIKDKGTRELSLALEAHNMRYKKQYKSVTANAKEVAKHGARSVSINMLGQEGSISGSGETGEASSK